MLGNFPVDGVDWSNQTLTEIEGQDWGEPTYPSYVVTNSHRLRHKPLCEFTAEDLRFMLGQQISLPILMPMALDVLEVDPFAGGETNHGALLCVALKVNPQFWQDYPSLWYRMNVVMVDLHSMRDLMENELLPAAAAFEANCPSDCQQTE
jgi:hypothetical protein